MNGIERWGPCSSLRPVIQPTEYVTAFGARMPDARPSMLLDHHARRRSEIDAINGMAVELGQRLSIPTSQPPTTKS